MIANAAEPKRLRIVIINMCDPDDEVEKMQYKVFMELLQYIKSATDSPDIEL